MTAARRHVDVRRVLVSALALLLAGLGLAAAGPAAASGQSGCPRQDKASNVLLLRPGQESVTFPGARSATYCAGAPAYVRTQLWPGQKPVDDRRVVVDGVGTWSRLDDGRLTFTVDPSFQQRPLGDSGPGRDAIMKFAVADQAGHYVPATAVAYVVYPGASGFADVLDTCTAGEVVRPLANDVAGWRGSTRENKQQARLLPQTLRLANTGTGGAVRTSQGVWRVLDQGRVSFAPASGWSGRTAPIRYSVRDTFGNTASATITATTCGASASPTSQRSTTRTSGSEAGPATTTTQQQDSSRQGIGTRVWLPLTLALLCVLAGGLALWRRRSTDGGEE